MQKIAVPVIAGLALLGVAGSPARAAVNLVANPGFETCTGDSPGDPASWTATGNVPCQFTPHSGQFSADIMGQTSTLSQAISTTAADRYDFSFWLEICADSGDTFAASFGGTEVLSAISTGAFIDYALEEFTVTATAPVTTIAFTGVPGGGFWGIDDVSVTDRAGTGVTCPTRHRARQLRQWRRNARQANAARAETDAA